MADRPKGFDGPLPGWMGGEAPPSPEDLLQVEPSAAVRAGATEIRALFLALVETGFSEDQAMSILARSIAASGAMGGA
jgi:hypothetical protein